MILAALWAIILGHVVLLFFHGLDNMQARKIARRRAHGTDSR